MSFATKQAAKPVVEIPAGSMVRLDESLPLVPIHGASSNSASSTVASTELEQPKALESWSQQSMSVLRDIGRTLMTPPHRKAP